MKGSTDNRAALRIVAGHLLQAAARGNTTAAEGHLKVYRAIVRSTQGQGKEVSPCL